MVTEERGSICLGGFVFFLKYGLHIEPRPALN